MDMHSTRPTEAHSGNRFTWTDGVKRASLPIDVKLQAVSDVLDAERQVLVKAGTGSGKTLRLTQMAMQRAATLPDAKVFVLEPKKVLVIRGAHNVTREINGAGSRHVHRVGGRVGYRIRGAEDLTSEQTLCEFRTKQSFLNEILKTKDKLPKGTIIVDEVHDPSWINDLLIGVLHERLPLNPQTEAIYCSATPDLEVFQAFSPNLQIIQCDSTPYPVERRIVDLRENEHHSEAALRTAASLLEDYSKGVLPNPGGGNGVYLSTGTILVLLPGKYDIHLGVEKLKQLSRKLGIESHVSLVACHSEAPERVLNSIEESPAPNTLRIVLGTDTAREGLTMGEVKYVIDSGQVKRKRITESGSEYLEKIVVDGCAIRQGIGRLGRTAPGVHFLVSCEADQKERRDKPEPDVYTSSISNLVMHVLLQDKDPLSFPLPHPLRREQFESTVKRLQMIGFLDAAGKVTQRGLHGSRRFPVEPEAAAACMRGEELDVLPETLVAILTLAKGNPFETPLVSSALNLDDGFIAFIESQEDTEETILKPLGINEVYSLQGMRLDPDLPSHRNLHKRLTRLSRAYHADGDTSDFSAVIGLMRELSAWIGSGDAAERQLEEWCRGRLVSLPRTREIHKEAQLLFKQLALQPSNLGENYHQSAVTEALVAGYPHLILHRESAGFSGQGREHVQLSHSSIYDSGEDVFAISAPLSKRNIGQYNVSYVHYSSTLAPVSVPMILNNLRNVISKIPQRDLRISANRDSIEQRYLYRLHYWNVGFDYEIPTASVEAAQFLREALQNDHLLLPEKLRIVFDSNRRIIDMVSGSGLVTSDSDLPTSQLDYERWLEDRLRDTFSVTDIREDHVKLPLARYRQAVLRHSLHSETTPP